MKYSEGSISDPMPLQKKTHINCKKPEYDKEDKQYMYD
jgi:hypothetical protein